MSSNKSTVVVLIVLAMMVSGCAVLYPRWHRCHQLTSTPSRFGITVISAPREVYGYDVRGTLSIALHEGGGLSLYLYNPQGFLVFEPREIYQCLRLDPAETQTWMNAAARLTAKLERRRGEARASILVTGAGGKAARLSAIEDLDPDALEAVRALACLAVRTFGKPGERAFRVASPLLATRLDFPATCVSPVDDVPER